MRTPANTPVKTIENTIGKAFRHLPRRAIVLVAVVATLASLTAAAPASAIPYLSRPEIIARAETALGSYYTWGGESWVPNAGGGTGPDCSGFVLKAWQAPRTMLYQEEHGVTSTISPRYTTYEFDRNLGPWYSLSSRSYLQPGDALVHRTSTGGHIVLYAAGDAWGSPIIYEAPYTGAQVRRVSRYLHSGFEPRRRERLSGSSILLDNPTARSVDGSDIGGNWRRSTSVGGYYGDNYQYDAATSRRSYARWTPRLDGSGYYTVYMRWTSSWNRASNAKVTINTPSGQKVKYVDQRSNGGRWVSLGRYYFRGGYSTSQGSVAIHATGANGYVVADAVLFRR